MRRRFTVAALVVGTLFVCGVFASAQPFSAQIQAALRWLSHANNTWTGTNTFTGTVIGPTAGTFGYFTRTGTVLSPSTAGNTLSLPLLALGTTTTPVLTLRNTTAAAAGAQQYSPGLSQIGQGWSTNGAGASMPVETRWEVRPVQGAAAPTYNYVLMGRVNNGAWTDLLSVNQIGTAVASTFQLGTSGGVQWGLNRSRIYSSSDGVIDLRISAETSGIRFQFAALPTIQAGTFCTTGGVNTVNAGSTDSAGSVTVGTCAAETSGQVNFATTWSATGRIT